MRISGVLLVLLSFPVLAASPADVDALIGAARSAPPEFSADALIRIAGVEQLDKNRRIELLAQAFERASSAQQPFKRHAAPLRSDGSPGYWNRVYSQDLDALSLRLRAVEAMLPLDQTKARELFVRIPVPATPALQCEDFLVYDVARFYNVLGALAKRLSSQEGGGAQAYELLARYAGALTAPVQAAPLARVLASAPVTDADFHKLVDSYKAALARVTGDDRSFSYSTRVGREMQGLVEECKRRKVSPLPLLEAYRVYLVINLSSKRCADDDLMVAGQVTFGAFATQPTQDASDDFVGFFNDKLRMPPLQPIQELEATPARLEGAATGLRVCEDEECRSIAKAIQGLVLGPNGSPYLPAEREKPEWQANFKSVVGSIVAWKQTKDTSPSEYFREKSAAYFNLVNLSPAGSNRETVLHGLLDFVKGNGFQNASRMEWFLPVNALIGRTGLDPLGLGKFAEELRQASDPVIALYAKLEAMAPRSPDAILGLL